MYALVNVRLGSTRLPGKVLKKIGDVTSLELLVSRIRMSKRIDDVIVNTSTNPIDDEIIDLCLAKGLLHSRGAEDDVLGRMIGACHQFKIDRFVEIFGDCPLIDYRIIDYAVDTFEDEQWDFVGNDLKTTYPPGFEVEVINAAALIESGNLCRDPEIREHGSLFIRQNPDRYRVKNFEWSGVPSVPLPHLTLDTQEDYELICRVHEACSGIYGDSYSLENVIALVEDRPSLLQINEHIPRKWNKYRE